MNVFQDERVRRYWFAWVREVSRQHAVNLTHQGVKERVLQVAHLAEWEGTLAEAQRAVLDYVQQKLRDAGDPVQLGLASARDAEKA